MCEQVHALVAEPAVAVTSPCRWCGAPLKENWALFCVECKAPQTFVGHLLYVLNFIGKNLVIPLAIALVTLILTSNQQQTVLIVAHRQKLAEALGEVGKVLDDRHLAETQISFMARAPGAMIPAKEFKDAVLKFDLSISAFGAKLGPFEEFARRTKYYGEIPTSEQTKLQQVWDDCFVKPYWGTGTSPGYLERIQAAVATCGVDTCPKAAATQLETVVHEFYKGLCRDGQQGRSFEAKWFNYELRAISVQEPDSNPFAPRNRPIVPKRRAE